MLCEYENLYYKKYRWECCCYDHQDAVNHAGVALRRV